MAADAQELHSAGKLSFCLSLSLFLLRMLTSTYWALCQKRRPIATAIELILPLFFFLIILILRETLTETTHPTGGTHAVHLAATPFSVSPESCLCAFLLLADVRCSFSISPLDVERPLVGPDS
jgi:hypothetical protein